MANMCSACFETVLLTEGFPINTGWVVQVSRMIVSGRDAVHQVVDKVGPVVPAVSTCVFATKLLSVSSAL